ncbi:hypothetical protein [Mucilaginibacter flavus]|uniref:hypothetical protein n=1 Tax=Mucilaginibacter flavus TaxID=931504 RepID=UPI0025B4C1B3|nr:hypothetical protein [Mucilaginibacter flavus]MDN3583630.1 hypothetical protein [Mucilaginibacter flavus]
MRNIFLFCIIALLIAGCKKDDSVKNSLSGSWEFRGKACFCTPPTDANADKPGNGNIISFEGNNYKIYAKHTLQKSGTYSVSIITIGSETRNKISFSDNPAYFPSYIKIEASKMTFYGDVPAAADGLELYYEKIK